MVLILNWFLLVIIMNKKESKESKEFRGQRIKAGIIEFEDKEKLQTLFIEVLKSSNK